MLAYMQEERDWKYSSVAFVTIYAFHNHIFLRLGKYYDLPF